MKAKEQVDRVAREFPTANLQDLESLDQLRKVSENISLFHASYPPEISAISELAWTKMGEGYGISVNRERLTISKDLRDEYWIRGTLQGHPVEINAQNISGAFNAADRFILEHGGIRGILKREAGWREAPPSEKQIAHCKRIGLNIPLGATKGMVSAAIDAKMNRVRA